MHTFSGEDMDGRHDECRVSKGVKPGGRLVYSTCSIEREENQAQVSAFLERHPEYALAEERLLLPTEDHDGAYAALLIH